MRSRHFFLPGELIFEPVIDTGSMDAKSSSRAGLFVPTEVTIQPEAMHQTELASVSP